MSLNPAHRCAQTADLQATATREQAQNKLLYAAPVTFPEPGKWQLAVTVGGMASRPTQRGLSTWPRLRRAVSYA